MKSAIVLACLLCGSSAACSSDRPAVPAGPQARRVCDVARHREDYAGWTLVLEGYLLASGHGSVVIDPQCGEGVAISWRDRDGRISAFTATAMAAQAEPMMVRIKVTGQMRHDGHSGMIDEPFWVLHLSDAQVLSARRLPWSDAERYMTWLDGPSPGPFRPGPVTPAPDNRAGSQPGR